MTTSTQILTRLDPEVAQLFREIAADPRSTLLRADRVPPMLDLDSAHETLTPLTPGLTVAERYLVKVHRRLVGVLANELAASILLDMEILKPHLASLFGPGASQPPRGRAAIRAELDDFPDPPASDGMSAPASAELRALVGDVHRSEHAVAGLLLALAGRFLNSPAPTLNSAVLEIARGNSHFALSSLEAVRSKIGRQVHQALFAMNSGMASACIARFDQAVVYYSSALKLTGSPQASKSMLLAALLERDTLQAEAATSSLAETIQDRTQLSHQVHGAVLQLESWTRNACLRSVLWANSAVLPPPSRELVREWLPKPTDCRTHP